MDSSKKTTPVSQRGIGAFLTGPNAAKYSDPNLPTRERPPKKQKLFLTTINEDGLGNVAEEIGIQSATLQLQPLIGSEQRAYSRYSEWSPNA
jgi:hypothetical protein